MLLTWQELPRPQSLSKGREENEKKFFALPGNDITATDLYSLQLHCTVPNEGPAEEAVARMQQVFEIPRYISYLTIIYLSLIVRKWIKKPNTCSSWSKFQLGHE